MRKIIVMAGFAALAGFTATAAADRYDATPEVRAYFNVDFGGQSSALRDAHYGLKLNQSPVFVSEDPLPPLFQLDFTKQGLNAAKVNGLNIVRQNYRLAQAEEEGGFFSSIGNWFSNLFGGGDDEEEEPASEGDGPFTSYSAVDWGLLAVGVVGIGFIASEIADSDESADLAEGGGNGEVDPCVENPLSAACAESCLLDPRPECLPLPLAGQSGAGVAETRMSPEYRSWLEGGSGQMGDLYD